MVPFLYEESTATTANLFNEAGTLKVELLHGQPYNVDNVPVVHGSSLGLHKYDVYVLDSTKSGPEFRTKEAGFYGRVLQPLFNDLFRVQHTYYATESSSSIREFSASLKSGGKPILMIIIAGDTSICEFINSLSNNSNGEITVFVVPAGTGNSLALSLGILDEKMAAQRLFLHSPNDVKSFNIYQAKFPERSHLVDNMGRTQILESPVLFVVVASWAFHASLVADSDTEEMRKHGVNRFKVAAHRNLDQVQQYNGDISVSGPIEMPLVHQGPFAYLVVTPSQKFEPNFNISPKGDIFSSDLYVVGFSTQTDQSYILDIMKKVYNNGEHVADKRVFYDKVDNNMKITLTMGVNKSVRERRFCVDGAIVLVPDVIGSHVTISYFGTKVHGWEISVIS